MTAQPDGTGEVLKLFNRTALLVLVSALSASCFAEQHPGAEEFARRAAEQYQLDEQTVLALLEQARFKQSIVDAITRPAEAKPWHEYRQIFLTPRRIDGGVAFWKENAARIERAAQNYQVDPHFIVAIIGVETLYGGNTGSYRVLDALATLAFHYPDTGNDRSAFFSSELMNFLVLGNEERLPLSEVTGSYAGAMGLGQFMPSSYREYAVDLDGDGRRDLWSSLDDVIGSVANYLHRHGWEYGAPVAWPLEAAPGSDRSLVSQGDFKPGRRVADLEAAGYRSTLPVDGETLAAIVRLEEAANRESFWLAFNNFYVITRYNRSPLYAMAVRDLAEAIREAMADEA